MPETSFTFGKIAAPPSPHAWSQVYNAGGLFAVISLRHAKLHAPEEQADEDEEDNLEHPRKKKEDNSLQILGKEIINTLEEEYFTLETKDLSSIQEALSITCQKIPDEVDGNVLVAAIVNGILFIVSYGSGKALLVRKESYTNLIEGTQNKSFEKTSGKLLGKDHIVLQSDAFSKNVSLSKLLSSLQTSAQETAEILSPLVHQKGEGAEAAIFITYHSSEPSLQEEEMQPDSESQPTDRKFTLKLPALSFPSFLKKFSFRFSGSQKLYLIIAAVIFCVLIGSIFFSIKKQQDAKTQALFKQVYSEAQSKYDEGQGLADLNKTLANEDFTKAQKILQDNSAKFAPTSPEGKQLADLLKKIADELSGSSLSVQVAEAAGKSPLLEEEKKDTATQYITQDDTYFYALSSSGVSVIDKKTEKTKKTIEKTWTSSGGIGVFFNNVYVLDTSTNQILKFVPRGTSYTKATYLSSDTTADFSKTVSLAIDGSIFVLSKDGSIQKFTRGKKDSFTLSGLSKPLNNPRRIYTYYDASKLYVLDSGNSRIVILDKSGVYQNEYQAKLLASAKDLEVMEKDKKLYFLSQNKIWQINLK